MSDKPCSACRYAAQRDGRQVCRHLIATMRAAKLFGLCDTQVSAQWARQSPDGPCRPEGALFERAAG